MLNVLVVLGGRIWGPVYGRLDAKFGATMLPAVVLLPHACCARQRGAAGPARLPTPPHHHLCSWRAWRS